MARERIDDGPGLGARSSLPLHMRKANLEQLLRRRPEGIFVHGGGGRQIGKALGVEGVCQKVEPLPTEI